jgi:hypothetical protein
VAIKDRKTKKKFMTPTTDSFDDYMKKVDNVKLSPLDRPKNSQRLEKEESLQDVLKEGQRLIDLETKVEKKPSGKSKKIDKKSESNPVSDSKNPYVRAKAEILSKWKKDPKLTSNAQEIEDMDAGKFPKNRFYDDFITQVRILGDSYPD